MSARALEFVETWVSEKIEAMKTLPAEGDEAAAKALANECLRAALDENIPPAEIQEAFDNLAEFIQGEIEEARERQ
jgi:SpoVK/Ycf46/Vps4 family AAA+-type ATPase